MPSLQKSRERVKIPIPRTIDEEGGSFQIDLGNVLIYPAPISNLTIDLVSVEDTHGCKKALAVPGMSVNVRRVKVGRV